MFVTYRITPTPNVCSTANISRSSSNHHILLNNNIRPPDGLLHDDRRLRPHPLLYNHGGLWPHPLLYHDRRLRSHPLLHNNSRVLGLLDPLLHDDGGLSSGGRSGRLLHHDGAVGRGGVWRGLVGISGGGGRVIIRIIGWICSGDTKSFLND